MVDKPVVGIISLNALPVIVSGAGANIGGLERRSWRVARALAASGGVRVRFIVRHSRIVKQRMVDGVEIVPLVDRLRNVKLSVSNSVTIRHQWPFLRIHWAVPSLIWQLPLLALTWPFRDRQPTEVRLDRLLEQICLNAVLVFGVSDESASAIRVSQKRRLPVLLWLASNADLSEKYFDGRELQGAYGDKADACRYALENATVIICQTLDQQRRLMRITGKSSTVIRNPIEIDQWGASKLGRTHRNYVLWVGRYDDFHKRPRLLIELARKCPELRFEMVANQKDPIIEREIRSTLPDNVQLVDFVPVDQMPMKIGNSRLLVSTGSGKYEGFPNVILEAAASGTPVVSLEDFDGFIEQSQCGRVSHGNVDQMCIQLRELWNSEVEWMACAQSGQDFVRDHYSIGKVITDLNYLLAQILGDPVE